MAGFEEMTTMRADRETDGVPPAVGRAFAPPSVHKAQDGAPTRTVELEPEEFAATHARHFATALCLQWDAEPIAEPVAMVVTELVTNAVVHTHQPLTLRMTRQPWGMRVEVTDADPNQPARTRAPVDALRGRGLRVVEGIASAWGVAPASSGKTVWAEVRLPDEAH